MDFEEKFQAGFEDEFEVARPPRRRGGDTYDLPPAEPEEKNYNEGLDPARNSRLVIFGGSFDPIHNAHVKLAEKILEMGLGDEVMFVPVKQQALKEEMPQATAEQRMEMLKLALEDNEKFCCSDIEIQREGRKTYTIDTLEILAKIYPDCKLYFLMGTDSLKTLHQWKSSFELVNRYDFIIYPRGGISAPTYAELTNYFGFKNANKLVKSIIADEDLPVWEESSSDLRSIAADGGELADRVPEKVWQYIKKNNIYRRG